MSKHPVGFMSYVRFDDERDYGRLTEFCKRLSGEVRMQTGETFEIFQDRKDIAWGQQWKQRIDESLDAVTFLIPIITPGFFKSSPCRDELERFIGREKQLSRYDLILPVYYVNCPILNDEAKREADPLAKVIASRQYADWRDLRFEPFTSPQVGKTVAKMATQIVEALERGEPPSLSVPFIAGTASKQASHRAPTMDLTREVVQQTSEAERSPADKTEPFMRVVDALHRGDHSTLTDALNAAKPGDRILVRPGLYREGIVIDKPVEIIGDGDLSEIVIEATGKPTVVFRASMGRIANLTLRQAGGGEWHSLDIAQGRLDVEACDITSQTLACVVIQGGADPRLRRNRIHDGNLCGVLVSDNGQGTLEDNEIFANAHSGVVITTGGNPTLRRNRIHDGNLCGVLASDNGQGTLEDNEIFANATGGVIITAGGNPTLRRNRITNNTGHAIWVYQGGQGVFEENDLRGNKRGAWDISPECQNKVSLNGNQE